MQTPEPNFIDRVAFVNRHLRKRSRVISFLGDATGINAGLEALDADFGVVEDPYQLVKRPRVDAAVYRPVTPSNSTGSMRLFRRKPLTRYGRFKRRARHGRRRVFRTERKFRRRAGKYRGSSRGTATADRRFRGYSAKAGRRSSAGGSFGTGKILGTYYDFYTMNGDVCAQYNKIQIPANPPMFHKLRWDWWRVKSINVYLDIVAIGPTKFMNQYQAAPAEYGTGAPVYPTNASLWWTESSCRPMMFARVNSTDNLEFNISDFNGLSGRHAQQGPFCPEDLVGFRQLSSKQTKFTMYRPTLWRDDVMHDDTNVAVSSDKTSSGWISTGEAAPVKFNMLDLLMRVPGYPLSEGNTGTPVVYSIQPFMTLRYRTTVIFEFKGRKTQPPYTGAINTAASSKDATALTNITISEGKPGLDSATTGPPLNTAPFPDWPSSG